MSVPTDKASSVSEGNGRAEERPRLETPEAARLGRMIKVSELIRELEDVRARFGETCVYIRDVSWGAVALNRQAEDRENACRDEDRAAMFFTSGPEPTLRHRLVEEFAAARAEERARTRGLAVALLKRAEESGKKLEGIIATCCRLDNLACGDEGPGCDRKGAVEGLCSSCFARSLLDTLGVLEEAREAIRVRGSV